MAGCTDENMGRLLHDYELNLLSPEDKHQFELHLYECDHCLTLVREFAELSQVIMHDTEAIAMIEEIADESSEVSSKRTRKEPFRFTNLLMAAAMVVVLAIPTYMFFLQPEDAGVMQTLELLPIRTGGNNIVYLEKGGDVQISFYVSESFTGNARLVISSIAGDTIVDTPDFSDFNDKGLGSITLPVADFSTGNYMLTATPSPETGVEERIYMFRVR
jgi:hypothetical protein